MVATQNSFGAYTWYTSGASSRKPEASMVNTSRKFRDFASMDSRSPVFISSKK